MPYYFLDTSALVKRFHLEPGSDRVNAIFDDRNNVLIISELAIVEFTSALRRRQKQGEITAQVMQDALAQFDTTVVNDLIVAGFRGGFIERARSLVMQHDLRTLDALQLAAVLQFTRLSPVFVGADGRLIKAASAVGLNTLNPEVIA